MDAGGISKIKGFLRKLHGTWVCKLTISQITSGMRPEDVKVPSDVPTCKKNLFSWLSESVAHLGQDKPARIAKLWESTALLRAWEREVQVRCHMSCTTCLSFHHPSLLR